MKIVAIFYCSTVFHLEGVHTPLCEVALIVGQMMLITAAWTCAFDLFKGRRGNAQKPKETTVNKKHMSIGGIVKEDID